MEGYVTEVLAAVFTLIFTLVAYKLTPSKSKCYSCGSAIPLSSMRFQGIFNVDGEPQQKVVCNTCHDTGIYRFVPEEGFCQKCSRLLKDIRSSIREVYEHQYVICDDCFEKIEGPEFVALNKLFNDAFITKNTIFSSLEAFIDSYDGNIESQADLERYTFSKYVQENSRFDSYENMLEVARKDYILDQYQRYIDS